MDVAAHRMDPHHHESLSSNFHGHGSYAGFPPSSGAAHGYGGMPVSLGPPAGPPVAGAPPVPMPGSTPMLPEHHEDQMKLGFQMIENAYNNKVQVLEQEARSLRGQCDEQKHQASSLQKKNSQIETQLAEGHQMTVALTEENRELFKTVQSLRKQLAKLDGLKKKVMQSFNDDGLPDPPSRSLMGMDPVPQALPAAIPMPHSTGAMRATPEPQMMTNSPRGIPGDSPKAAHGNPVDPVDGRGFFRQARHVLSHEAFNDFLGNIKRLNSQRQTREETMQEARRIFGPEHVALYREFEQLLNRHGIAP